MGVSGWPRSPLTEDADGGRCAVIARPRERSRTQQFRVVGMCNNGHHTFIGEVESHDFYRNRMSGI